MLMKRQIPSEKSGRHPGCVDVFRDVVRRVWSQLRELPVERMVFSRNISKEPRG